MRVYRSPTPTDNFITITKQMDSAFGNLSGVRLMEKWFEWLLSVHTWFLCLSAADDVARRTSLIYSDHCIAYVDSAPLEVCISFLHLKKGSTYHYFTQTAQVEALLTVKGLGGNDLTLGCQGKSDAVVLVCVKGQGWNFMFCFIYFC